MNELLAVYQDLLAGRGSMPVLVRIGVAQLIHKKETGIHFFGLAACCVFNQPTWSTS
jgi:hypothetical protein